MIRGGLPAIGFLSLALLVLLCCVSIPVSVKAQNTAEKDPPVNEQEEKPADSPEKKESSQGSSSSNVNAAEGGSEKDQQTTDPDTGKPIPEKKETDNKDSKEIPADPANPVDDKTGVKPAGDEPAGTGTNVAEAGKPSEETEKPTPGPGNAVPPVNTAESTEEDPADDAINPASNVAEADPDSTGDGTSTEIAEPPETEEILPHPGDVAGKAADYTEPALSVDVPVLDEIGAAPSLDEFYVPGRTYLDSRPLPGQDITETDRERMARNVEQSLSLLDLATETRPDGGITIPLPSGELTFKASDAFQYDRRNRILTFTGNAELIFDRIAVWADFIEVNDQAATAYAKGYVAIQQGEDIVFADEAYINYDAETFELFYVEGNTGGSKVQGHIFFTAERALGSFDHMILYNAEVTTCDPYCGQLKEYSLSARKVNYRPNHSVTLHDVWINVHNNKVGYVPLLSFPLREPDFNFEQEESEVQQTYGWSRAEGAYAKFAYTYSTRYIDNATKPLRGVVKMEVMQRRGVGFGLRQDFYTSALGITTVSTYIKEEWPQMVAIDLFGRKESTSDSGNEFSFLLDQELNFSGDLTGSLKVDRQKSFVPSFTVGSSGRLTNTWRNNLNLSFRNNDTNVTLSGRHNIDISGGSTNSDGTQEPRRERVNASGNATIKQKLSEELDLSISGGVTSNKGQSQARLAADQEANYSVDLNFRGKQDTGLDGYTAKLIYSESGIDLDDDNNTTDRNTAVDRKLPSFELTGPRDLINDGAYFTTFKLNLDKLVTGRRRDSQKAERMKLEMGGSDRFAFSGSSNVSTNTNLKQYWYDDTNSQYVINNSVNYVYDPKSWYRFDASWRLNYQQGVREPPVRGDRSTKQQTVTYNWTFGNSRNWRWQLRSGYNFETGRPNPISSTVTFDPNRTFGLTHTLQLRQNLRGNSDTGNDTTHTSYTFNNSHLVSTWRSPYIADDGYYNWLLNFTIDNNPEEEWDLTRLSTSWFKRWGYGWSSELVGAYRQTDDGPNPDLSNAFLADYIRKVTIRKVNCCTTMELGYRVGIKEVYLNMYVNALPQYPAHADYRAQNSHAVGDTYFPWERMRQDVLSDVFGINQSIPFF